MAMMLADTMTMLIAMMVTQMRMIKVPTIMVRMKMIRMRITETIVNNMITTDKDDDCDEGIDNNVENRMMMIMILNC